MKREGFWRDVTPPLNIYGVPLPFTMIYLLLFPYPSKTTFWVCSGILLFLCSWGTQDGLSGRSAGVCTAWCRVNRRQAVPGGTDIAQNYPVNGAERNNPLLFIIPAYHNALIFNPRRTT